MLTTEEIGELTASCTPEEQLVRLSDAIAVTADDRDRALLLAERGKVHWRLGHRGAAISDYEGGTMLDPDGPASVLLAHSRSIMDFFNPDLLNP